ncbi:hypothetical protein E3N88_33603 [Mikania micrantha]|uniref:Uncharacterized protein n=1 Tax=Mikania micrantha TaxID=192012 RepID=A0A5N6MCA3_9ASTR|nr:hypothetical protein E3N88_33603 [Mikania micrantha]
MDKGISIEIGEGQPHVKDSELEEEQDVGAPLIPIQIGELKVSKALLDYGASVSILPGSLYDQYEFGPLQPVDTTVVLADMTRKRPRGMLIGVAVKIGEFYYPEDFLVLDYAPNVKQEQIIAILGRPFLATANAQINCRDSLVSMTSGNLKNDKKVMKEEHKVEESNVKQEKLPERPQVESSKVHIKLESKSSKASISLKKPSKFVKHSYENGEFVKKREGAEEVKMENKGDPSLSWIDNNQSGDYPAPQMENKIYVQKKLQYHK